MKLAIIDFNRTIYDPGTDSLVPGARELLAALAERGVCMILLSRDEGERLDILERLGVEHFFAEAFFVAEKTAAVIREIMSKYRVAPHDTFVLGDYLHKEIRVGNEAGAYTIHFKSGLFASLRPETEHDIPNAVSEKLEEATGLFV